MLASLATLRSGRQAAAAAARGWLARYCLIAFALLGAGCTTSIERAIAPESLAAKAEIDGMSDVRTWGDEAQASTHRFIAAEGPKIAAKLREMRGRGQQPVSHMLALSGGADDGAFGAGLLVGWGQKGDRPPFDLVTGVSAGALIAPFAFAGADYDRQLSEIFTSYGGDQIFQANVLAGILGGPGLARNDPLKRLIAKYVDQDLVRRIGEERGKGRILLVGTTNIDMQRPVFWDIGRIAQSGHPRALALIRDVLIASAAIPGVFPPVRIRVKADGKEYEELHVDGGTTREVFFSPADFSFREIDKMVGVRVKRRLFVIRNGKLGPEWEATEETALALGARSLSTVLKNQTIGDLIRMHVKAKSEGIDYNLAAIPDSFRASRPAPFDQDYMKALYGEGLRLGREGYAWMKQPPGILATTARQ